MATGGEDTARDPLPLEGIRVLDFGQVWAGPLLGLYLADFGAEVIKVESAARVAVQASSAGAPDRTTAQPYNDNARNKLSVSLDPTTEAGRALLHRLVAASDVVFDNFSPRGARKVGLIYDELRAVNPRIIMASLSAAGQSGPWSDLVTYGPSLTALYGIKSLLGYAGESQPMEDVADLDPTAATYAFIAILAALNARERTGEGQFIDMAQGEAGVAGLAEAVLEYTLNGRVMGPTGNQHRAMSPHGIYPARGEDQWISVAVDSDEAWQAFCRVLGAGALASDTRFAGAYGRLRQRDELDALVAGLTADQDAAALAEALQAAGVAALPVYDALAAFGDSQLASRREQVRVTAPGISPSEIVSGTPWLLSESPATVVRPAPLVGEHNDYVYRDVLGMSDAEIEAARAAGGIP